MATRRKKTAENGKFRLNLRLPVDLERWVKGYAKAQNTTVTQIVVDHLTSLKASTEAGYARQA